MQENMKIITPYTSTPSHTYTPNMSVRLILGVIWTLEGVWLEVEVLSAVVFSLAVAEGKPSDPWRDKFIANSAPYRPLLTPRLPYLPREEEVGQG